MRRWSWNQSCAVASRYFANFYRVPAQTAKIGNSRSSHTMETNDEEVDDNLNTEEDDEPDLSRVLNLLLRSGVHLSASGILGHVEDDSDEDSNDSLLVNQANLQEPDTMEESDLMQEILLSSGKLSRDSKSPSTGNEKLLSYLRDREISCCGARKKTVFTSGCRTAICSQQIPNKVTNSVKLREKIFCGIYSENGSTFLSACQDGYIRVYDATRFKVSMDPCLPFKNIPAIDVGWSILDVAFSPDSLFLAYSTWSSDLHIASVHDNDDVNLSSHRALDLRPENYSFAAFSIQFSGDGNEILCGTNDGHLYIYDRQLNSRTSRIYAHEDDINAIRFADKSSQILYSGGDDGIINVWDRRMLRENCPQKVGSFAGHVDGITFIDSKEDTRYLLSNSKDQTIKIWDMRKFSSVEAQDAVKRVVSHQTWDYRWQQIPKRQQNSKKTVAGDTSIKTYHGHSVSNTLIRARFSPMHSTGQKYIYCGCSKGNVFIYDIVSGDVVSKMREHMHCVRDVSWHPFEPTIVSSSWDGNLFIWDYETDKESERGSVRPARKRTHKSRGCCDDDDEHKANRRRSPRSARSAHES